MINGYTLIMYNSMEIFLICNHTTSTMYLIYFYIAYMLRKYDRITTTQTAKKMYSGPQFPAIISISGQINDNYILSSGKYLMHIQVEKKVKVSSAGSIGMKGVIFGLSLKRSVYQTGNGSCPDKDLLWTFKEKLKSAESKVIL